ncbi:MAG TPA: hypothetical protein VEA69_10550 [Tepidisphaeraceae bacterium]|nr:hypothetical protein [Tepidisphaeraceae bacterium]
MSAIRHLLGSANAAAAGTFAPTTARSSAAIAGLSTWVCGFLRLTVAARAVTVGGLASSANAPHASPRIWPGRIPVS